LKLRYNFTSCLMAVSLRAILIRNAMAVEQAAGG
jgi:hypothetical protein